MRLMSLIILSIAIVGCTTRGAYEAIQMNQHNTCSQYRGQQYDECMDSNRQTYDEYMESRKASN